MICLFYHDHLSFMHEYFGGFQSFVGAVFLLKAILDFSEYRQIFSTPGISSLSYCSLQGIKLLSCLRIKSIRINNFQMIFLEKKKIIPSTSTYEPRVS